MLEGLESMLEEVAVINPGKSKSKKKKTTKKKTAKKKSKPKKKAAKKKTTKSASAKKAAATRKRKAKERSLAGKKAARTRKRNEAKRKLDAKRSAAKRKRSVKKNPKKGSAKKVASKNKNYGIRMNPVEKDVMETVKTGVLMAVGAIAGYVGVSYLKEKVAFVAENETVASLAMIASGITIGSVLKGKNKRLASMLGYGAVTAGIIQLVTPYIQDKLPGLPGSASEDMITIPGPVSGYYPAEEIGAYVPVEPGMVGDVNPFDYAGDAYYDM